MLVAGIDGGQSSTVAVIADARGNELARGTAGPADELGDDARSTRLRDALSEALSEATRNAGLPPDTRFNAVVAGVSGYEGRVHGAAPHLPTDRLVVMHDAPIAHAGAFVCGPGVVVIAGTGSAAYGVSDDGQTFTLGGWGYLFGDEGSAFWIVRRAISAATAHRNCAGIEALLSFFDVRSLRELVRDFYMGKTTRNEMAAFAPRCIESARTGNGCSCLEAPVHAAAAELARLAVGSEAEFSRGLPVAFTGGLLRSAWFKSRVYDEVAHVCGDARLTIVEPAHEPVIGAVMLALREAVRE